MITSGRTRDELTSSDGFDWITALRAPQIQQLLQAGTLQLSLLGATSPRSPTRPIPVNV